MGHHRHGSTPFRPVLPFGSWHSVPHRSLRTLPATQAPLLPDQRNDSLHSHVPAGHCGILPTTRLRGEG